MDDKSLVTIDDVLPHKFSCDYYLTLGGIRQHIINQPTLSDNNRRNVDLLQSEAFKKRFSVFLSKEFQDDRYDILRSELEKDHNDLSWRASADIGHFQERSAEIGMKLQNEMMMEHSVVTQGRPKELFEVVSYDEKKRDVLVRFNIPQHENGNDLVYGFTRMVHSDGDYKHLVTALSNAARMWEEDKLFHHEFRKCFASTYLDSNNKDDLKFDSSNLSITHNSDFQLISYRNYVTAFESKQTCLDILKEVKAHRKERESRYFGLGKYIDKIIHRDVIKSEDKALLHAVRGIQEADDYFKHAPRNEVLDLVTYKHVNDMLAPLVNGQQRPYQEHVIHRVTREDIFGKSREPQLDLSDIHKKRDVSRHQLCVHR